MTSYEKDRPVRVSRIEKVTQVFRITRDMPTTITVDGDGKHCSRECQYLNERYPVSSGYTDYACKLFRRGLYSNTHNPNPSMISHGRERCDECINAFGGITGDNNTGSQAQ